MKSQARLLAPPEGFPVLGMIGGGQLSRMTHQAAGGLGIGFRVLAQNPDESAARLVAESVFGDPDDPQSATEFASACDVVTFDHEQVPPATLAAMAAAGAVLRPGPQALELAQDKVTMRQRLQEAGVPVPDWAVVTDLGQARAFLKEHGGQAVLKLSRGGYDGRGVWICHNDADLASAMRHPLSPGAQWLIEELVPFEQELAALVARRPNGETVAYPVVRTLQRNGMCAEVIAPAPEISAELAAQAQQIARSVAELSGVVGILAVELFQTPQAVLVNELAMRPHNSGHWSIDGAVTSQFENHVRAVLDLPLGDPAQRQEWSVMVNVIGRSAQDLYESLPDVVAADPDLKIHLYGKAVRSGRKLGHVTAFGSDLAEVADRARAGAEHLMGAADE
ncbi:MAG: 5-(carboxyamino)imidazole ribonucleotide synthase [Actinomycetia bacterium]|nr:5-(carboxyamino)imidazole ribonucleotide synthase [Actinomycetes bacterium]